MSITRILELPVSEQTSIKYTCIHEVGELDLIGKYVQAENKASSGGPCLTALTEQRCFTQGVYNCISVAIVTESKEGILMHAIPSQAIHFLDELLHRVAKKELILKSILIGGGAEEGKRMGERVYKELKEFANEVLWITPPNDNSSVSIGVDPQDKRIEYSINRYINIEAIL